MKVLVDFLDKKVHFNDTSSMDEIAMYLHNYFPTEKWGDFNFMIDGRTDENPDIGR